MQYCTERHRHTCGVDLHGRKLYLCVLDPGREIVLHRRVDCDEEKLLRALAPYREDLVRPIMVHDRPRTPGVAYDARPQE